MRRRQRFWAGVRVAIITADSPGLGEVNGQEPRPEAIPGYAGRGVVPRWSGGSSVEVCEGPLEGAEIMPGVGVVGVVQPPGHPGLPSRVQSQYELAAEAKHSCPIGKCVAWQKWTAFECSVHGVYSVRKRPARSEPGKAAGRALAQPGAGVGSRARVRGRGSRSNLSRIESSQAYTQIAAGKCGVAGRLFIQCVRLCVRCRACGRW